MSVRLSGRFGGGLCGLLFLVVTPVASLSMYGCSSAPPVELGSGSAEELEIVKEISLNEIELHVAPEVVETRRDLMVRRVFVDELSLAHTHVQQTYKGVPVFGGEAIVHLNRDGSYRDMTDAFIRVPRSLDVTPKFDALKARELVLGQYECTECLTAEPEVDMVVLPHGRELRLAYRVQLFREDGTEKTAMPVIFIDAKTGEKLMEYNNLQTASGTSLYSGNVTITTSSLSGTYYMEDTTKKIGTFNNNNTPASNSGNGTTSRYTDTDDVWNSAAQKAGVDAHWGATQVYDYYKSKHNRTGINGSGGPGATTAAANSSIKLITSKVHYGSKYNNAYWNGSWMTYGDGDGTTFTPLVTLDICGHEMTHGVITATANLAYQNESGALNEAIADIFGAMVERFAKGESAKTWLIGEECFTPANGTNDALRYMNDPHKASNSGFTADDDPDHYSEKYSGASDNGGVHINSGIVNKMFYLLAVGGSHHKGGSMTGIGADDAAKIVYKALTTYMTSSTNFAGARTAMEKAATDLFGGSSTQYTAVQQAWYLVGVGAAPGGGGGNPPPPSCAHSECTTGVALTSGCSTCVTAMCAADPYCCNTEWDAICVGNVDSVCGTAVCP